MSNVYTIADLHFGHNGIERFRPQVKNTDHNTEMLMDNILTVCNKRDTLWLLGDCFLSVESLPYLKQLSERIGYIHWVLGNHDTQATRYRDIVLPAIESGYVKSVHGIYKTKGKNRAWLSHAPIHPQELWGKINIHGHVHNNTIPDDRYVNVSCDNTDFKPVKLQDIFSGWRTSKS